MSESIFTKIINREIPANIVYEDDLVIAFLTIEPVNHGHTLVVPKKPFINIFDGDIDTLAHMMKVGQKIAIALKENELAEGVNLLLNNGKEADQYVFHAHLHIIPRLQGDGAFQTPKHIKNAEEHFDQVQQKLSQALKSN